MPDGVYLCTCGLKQSSGASGSVQLSSVRLIQGLGGSWQEAAPEKLRVKLGLAVRQLKDLWRIGEHRLVQISCCCQAVFMPDAHKA